MPLSRPMRARGLKHHEEPGHKPIDSSRPMRARGLKLVHINLVVLYINFVVCLGKKRDRPANSETASHYGSVTACPMSDISGPMIRPIIITACQSSGTDQAIDGRKRGSLPPARPVSMFVIIPRTRTEETCSSK